jgi:hypothetical protein
LNSQKENQWLLQFVNGGARQWFIGGHRPATGVESDFSWVTGEPMSFSNWVPGQPVAGDAGAKPVMVFNDHTAKWSAAPDKSGSAEGFIVEWDSDVTGGATPGQPAAPEKGVTEGSRLFPLR